MEQEKVFRHWYLRYKRSHPFVCGDNVFTAEECAKICELAQKENKETGLIDEGVNNADTRKGTLRWLNSADPEQEWIFQRLTDVVLSLNKDWYGFDLDYIEILQFTEYHEIGDFYGDHVDFYYGGLHRRKLSFSVQLSDEADYDGCDLEMIYGKNAKETASRTQGSITIFPSFQLHRVTPLLRGKRTALVGWVDGPPWK